MRPFLFVLWIANQVGNDGFRGCLDQSYNRHPLEKGDPLISFVVVKFGVARRCVQEDPETSLG